MRKVEQDKDENLDWSFDYTGVLNGDTILSSTWALDPSSPTDINVTAPSESNGVTTVWVSGGTYGRFYKVTNEVTMTPSGRIFNRTLNIRIVEK